MGVSSETRLCQVHFKQWKYSFIQHTICDSLLQGAVGCYRWQKFSWILKATHQNKYYNTTTTSGSESRSHKPLGAWRSILKSIINCLFVFTLFPKIFAVAMILGHLGGLFLYDVILSSQKYQKLPDLIVIAPPGLILCLFWQSVSNSLWKPNQSYSD